MDKMKNKIAMLAILGGAVSAYAGVGGFFDWFNLSTEVNLFADHLQELPGMQDGLLDPSVFVDEELFFGGNEQPEVGGSESNQMTVESELLTLEAFSQLTEGEQIDYCLEIIQIAESFLENGGYEESVTIVRFLICIFLEEDYDAQRFGQVLISLCDFIDNASDHIFIKKSALGVILEKRDALEDVSLSAGELDEIVLDEVIEFESSNEEEEESEFNSEPMGLEDYLIYVLGESENALYGKRERINVVKHILKEEWDFINWSEDSWDLLCILGGCINGQKGVILHRDALGAALQVIQVLLDDEFPFDLREESSWASYLERHLRDYLFKNREQQDEHYEHVEDVLHNFNQGYGRLELRSVDFVRSASSSASGSGASFYDEDDEDGEDVVFVIESRSKRKSFEVPSDNQEKEVPEEENLRDDHDNKINSGSNVEEEAHSHDNHNNVDSHGGYGSSSQKNYKPKRLINAEKCELLSELKELRKKYRVFTNECPSVLRNLVRVDTNNPRALRRRDWARIFTELTVLRSLDDSEENAQEKLYSEEEELARLAKALEEAANQAPQMDARTEGFVDSSDSDNDENYYSAEEDDYLDI